MVQPLIRTGAPKETPDPTKENVELLVIQVESRGWKDFGFWAFRVHYSDDKLYEEFSKAFDELVDEGVDSAPAESGMHRIKDNVFTRHVSDEHLANQGPEGISYAYQICLGDDGSADDDDDDDENAEGWPEGPEPGMAMSMCLMVDEECMRSAVNREPGSTPFVKAIDARLCQPEGKRLPYAGYFKVAITSLITKFYAALLLYDPADVAATVRDGIWTDIGPFDRDREFIKLEKLSAAA